jgi:uncharacterized cupredoxin-like copper-binding protein
MVPARHPSAGGPWTGTSPDAAGARAAGGGYSLDVTPSPPSVAPRISRAPVIVVGAFFAIAVTLVVIGAQLSLNPAPAVTVTAPGTADAPRAINVIMRDYHFDPTPVVLVPGETVRITVFNAGMVEHELTLGAAAVQEAWFKADAAATPPAPFASAPPASVPPGTGGLRVLLSSGRQQVVEYTVPATGEVLLLCNLPGHIARGMIGRVELQPRDRAGGSPTPAGAG